MNLREGRIGIAEGISLVLIAAAISGIFAADTRGLFARGNSSYAASLLSALLTYLIFVLITFSMKRAGAEHLSELYECALGRLFGGAAAAATMLSLVIAATVPLTRLLFVLCRYVYPEASIAPVALFFLPAVLVPVFYGLEAIGRVGKLLLGVTALSFLVAFAIAAPAYAPFRLYPLLGDGVWAMLRNSAAGVGRYLPAAVSILICGQGVHGLDNAARDGRLGLLAGGALSAAAWLCVSLAYGYADLAAMDVPLYRLTMSVRTSNVFLRADKALLFFWVMAGFLTAAFYTYAGALLYCKTCRVRDIRPIGAMLASAAVALALMGQMNFPWYARAETFFSNYLGAFLFAPALAAAAVPLFRKKAVAA